jgi:selenide,water dikinase
MARASGVTLSIDAARVPLFSGVAEFAAQNQSGGMVANQAHFGAAVHIDDRVEGALQLLFFDPQTSGGLLVAANGGRAEQVEAALWSADVRAARIGIVGRSKPGCLIDIRP